jgi:hypothetical protein
MARNNIKSIHVATGKRTKEEIQRRIKAEEETKTGQEMKPSEEVLNNKFALAEFKEMKEIYKIIKQDDAIHERTISRYCLMLADEKEILISIRNIKKQIKELDAKHKAQEIEEELYMEWSDKLWKRKSAEERALERKQKMILDIEKSSCLTLADRLRAIPKKEETKEPSKLERYMSERKG